MWLRLSALVVCLHSFGCRPEPPSRSEPRPFEGRGFSATIRRDVRHSAETPTHGVTLYDFHVGSLPLLFVYTGDDAGYPHFSWAADREAEQTLPSGLKAHCRFAETSDGRARECLIALSKTSPKQVMVFYEKLPAKWADVADEIIESIEPSDP
jgi:hypothetical protein